MTIRPTDRRGRPVRCLLLVALALAVSTACGSGSGDEDPSAGSSTTAAITSTTDFDPADVVPVESAGCASDPGGPEVVRGEHVEEAIDTEDGERTYQRYVPSEMPESPVPLVVDLHGYQSGAAIQTQLSEMSAVADREGFVVVTPQGSGDLPYWNAVPEPSLPDDVAFIEAVIDDVGGRLCIDEARVFVDGFSNGAFLASLLACRLADEVAAIAAVAGLMRPADCDPARPVPALAFHGTEDSFVGYDGPPNPALDDLEWDDASLLAFADLPFAPVRETAAAWAAANGCGEEAISSEPAEGISTSTYGSCTDGAGVVLHTVEGGGHTWPGSEFTELSGSLLGPTNMAVDASALIWEFFMAHPKVA